MSVITYTASRGIVATGFSVTGTDISAATSDDSFNATSTDISGMLDDEWVNVSGFATAANNGWFQVNGNSTTTKIIQDTANLTDEAAGESVTITGYYRGSGESYNLEFGAKARTISRKVFIDRAKSLSGVTETLRHRTEALWEISTTGIAKADVTQWWEFFRSVEAGESFTWDAEGTVASPDNPVSVILESDTIQQTPMGMRDQYFTFTFQVREL